jgi:predicted transposase/invertase (TIGR01784 family)
MIALLDGFILEDSPADKFIQNIDLRYEGNNKIFYDKISFKFIELLKFDKREDELITDLDKWMYVLKNMGQMMKLPVYLRKPIFQKLFHIAEYSNFTREEKKMFDRLQKMRWDNQNVRDYELKVGIEEAVQEKQRTTAIELKKLNIPLDKIAAITELSIEEVAQL